MALTDSDKKWMSHTFSTKEDVQTAQKDTDNKIAGLEERIDRAFQASEERSDKKRVEQSEFFTNALRNQTQEILNSVASREKLEAVENRVDELEDEVANLKTKLQTVAAE